MEVQQLIRAFLCFHIKSLICSVLKMYECCNHVVPSQTSTVPLQLHPTPNPPTPSLPNTYTSFCIVNSLYIAQHDFICRTQLLTALFLQYSDIIILSTQSNLKSERLFLYNLIVSLSSARHDNKGRLEDPQDLSLYGLAMGHFLCTYVYVSNE